ncbi:MAG: CPBP family intramembrane metalloprotease [Lactobacillus sp.]|nr:CPBP family intramembrane metalloprotease [Lactobacillus sp.]
MQTPQQPYTDGPWIKLGKFIGLFFLLMVPQLVLFLPMNSKVSPAIYWPLFAGAYLVAYIIYLYYFRHYRKPGPQPLNKQAWLTIVFGFLAMKVATLVLYPLNQLVGHEAVTKNDQIISQLMSSSNRNVVVMTVMMGVFFAPLAEELLFRGVLMNFFFKNRFWPGILISAVAFGLSHANNTWTGALTYIVLGGILAFIYKKTNNLKITIVIHFLNNFPLLLLLFLG